MRRKITALASVFLCIAMALSAQDSRNNAKTVVFNNLTYVKKQQKANASSVLGAIVDALANNQVTEEQGNSEEAVRAHIVKGMSQARRIRMMDGTGLSQADWYVDGTITNVSTTTKVEETKDSKGKPHKTTYYKALVGVTLHVKDAQSSEILMSPTFNVYAEDCSWIETKEGALQNAYERLASSARKYFNRQLPLYAEIIEGAREKKDRQKEVYINLGSATKGIAKRLAFGVYTTKTVAGKEARKRIGKIKITDVEGDDISLCSVSSGGKDIKAAIEAGTPLLIISEE